MVYAPQPGNTVFTETDESWVHNPHQDAMIITTEVAHSLVHLLVVDSGSTINILYWGTYQKTGLKTSRLDLDDLSSLWVHQG